MAHQFCASLCWCHIHSASTTNWCTTSCKSTWIMSHTKSAIPSLLRQDSRLSASHILQTQAAAHVYPFRANNYVVDHLIDWSNVLMDPIFQLTFPQPEMLKSRDTRSMLDLMEATQHLEASRIRQHLNPHPAAQKELDVLTLR